MKTFMGTANVITEKTENPDRCYLESELKWDWDGLFSFRKEKSK